MPANPSRIVGHNRMPEFLGVAVGPGPHAGVVYRGRDAVMRLLHFAFHRNLRGDDEYSTCMGLWLCVQLNVLRSEQVAIAGYCRLVFEVNASRRNIPYNLRYEVGTGFDPDTGELILPAGATGMSCATFVVHLFRSAGSPILDAANWPAERPGDRERQERLVAMLRNHRNVETQVHAEVVASQIGCPRISPEDVVSACLEDDLPAVFQQCETNARLIATVIAARAGHYV
jgi:hypothetical protein